MRSAHAFTVVLSISVAALVPAGDGAVARSPQAPAEIERIERAVITADLEALRHAEAALASGIADEQIERVPLVAYTLAYVRWRIAAVLEMRPDTEDERDDLLEAAQEVLEALVQAEQDNAEAWALLGGVIGQRIPLGFAMWRGMRMGPRASDALDRASELAPENPRVALQQGIGDLFTPGMFGGGVDKAEQELARATDLFDGQPADEPWPSWGRLDAYAWLGQVYVRQEKTEAARALYREGLALEPDHVWIRDVLLPQLEHSYLTGDIEPRR